MQKIYDKLNELKINFKDFSHKATFSCNEARSVEIPGERVKSLILTNKQKNKFVMVVLSDEKKLDVKILQKYFWEKKFSFAKNEDILEKIWVEIGHISPFALINNSKKDIFLIFDKILKWKEIWFHPLINTKTIVLNLNDMEFFLENIWFKSEFLEL